MHIRELSLKSSIIDSEKNKPLEEDEEMAEIFSRAFYEITKDYFKLKFEREKTIESLKNNRKKNMVVGIFVTLLGLVLSFASPGFVILFVIGLIIVFYSNRKYQKLIKEVEDAIANQRPEGEITFISKVYIPFYVFPYNGGSIVFDGINAGDKKLIELVSINTSELIKNVNKLEIEVEKLKSLGKDAIEIGKIQEYDEKIIWNKILENRVVDILLNIKNVIRNFSVKQFEFYAHQPDSNIIRSLKYLFDKNLFQELGDVNTVPLTLSFDQAVRNISELKGLEIEASVRDLKELLDSCATRIDRSINSLLNELQQNVNLVKNYYMSLYNTTDAFTSKYLCSKCHAVDESEYDISGIIEKGLRRTISILEEFGDENTVKKIREDLRSLKETGLEIPKELVSATPSGYNVAFIDELGNVKFRCITHGDEIPIVKTIAGSDVLARVSTYVFNELKRPVIEKADELFKELNRANTDIRKEKLAIAQLEQFYKQLEIEEKRISYEIQSLGNVVNSLR
ncbi:MAG: hypothetical protein NZ903_01640 [Candidatus Micrarchaeota archaeon]|nr:hypothetical protein [Candidatus Micrarchaeota archaeon]